MGISSRDMLEILPANHPSRAALEARIGGGKYRVARKDERTVDGITFASKRELSRWRTLCDMKRAGIVKMILRQTPFHLPGNVKYLADFTVFYTDGRVEFEDSKGAKTQTYIIKRKMVKAIYGVEIKEV